MSDKQTQLDHIEDLMIERDTAIQLARRWRAIATMFYERHEDRRNCSLIVSCKQCDAYEEMVADGN